jgi:ABC-type glutathione transport system ATPase component
MRGNNSVAGNRILFDWQAILRRTTELAVFSTRVRYPLGIGSVGEAPATVNTQPKLKDSQSMNAAPLSRVCKAFGEVRTVDNLSVRVPAESIYGFLGPNGAGKTTTIRMTMNIIRPDHGDIEIFRDHSIERAKTRIGYMTEERGLYRKMSRAGNDMGCNQGI